MIRRVWLLVRGRGLGRGSCNARGCRRWFLPVRAVPLLITAGLVGCLPGHGTRPLSPEAVQYIDTALALVRGHVIASDSVDWLKLRRQTLRRASGARTPAQTHDALEWMVRKVNPHSRLVLPDFWLEVEEKIAKEPPLPQGHMLPWNIGYIALPGIFTGSSQIIQSYARTGQSLIRSYRDSAVCGWILDLREDNGGDLNPMLAAIGPLLGDGPVGFTRTGAGAITAFGYERGRVWVGADTTLRLPPAEVTPTLTTPVAVLLGPRTASAGEAVAIAFRGVSRATSFGSSTAGFTTGNRSYPLSDGAFVIVTETVLGDRLAREYGGVLHPEVSTGPTWLNEFADARDVITVPAAMRWLRQQPDCVRALGPYYRNQQPR